ncbi:cadherin-like domain-containing protein [Streptomyces melanogenes]|uniref:cadherin-like domain-containing protein n=1 Tax=Streptomyces melanogenes TaxID=67326 RepID=UPI00167CCF69|nr:cadherin-like domain-containing protein [Streptomyces melanogenes]GGP89344.1 hypothetical protein GCM10010278_79740 [Streptomyces melanogenes]
MNRLASRFAVVALASSAVLGLGLGPAFAAQGPCPDRTDKKPLPCYCKPPHGMDDSATTPAGVPVDIAVLANDTDALKPTLVSVSQPGHGTAVINADGTVTYTPAPGYSGPDTFTYTAKDLLGRTYTDTVNITVTPVGADDSATTAAGVPVGVPVLANDAGVSSPSLVSVSQPGHGTAVINADGTVTYTPAPGYSGPDTFTYTAKDASGQPYTQTVKITVTPVGADDSAVTRVDVPVTIWVLANDAGVSSPSLVSVSQPGHGTAVVNGDGTVTYTPAPGYDGPDMFTYTGKDASGQPYSQIVYITVNC